MDKQIIFMGYINHVGLSNGIILIYLNGIVDKDHNGLPRGFTVARMWKTHIVSLRRWSRNDFWNAGFSAKWCSLKDGKIPLDKKDG